MKAYAFKENFDTTIASWNRIQNKSKEMEKFFNYPMKSMLLHYILCTVNGSLNYKITGLSDEFRLIRKTKIDEVYYESGTNIEELILQDTPIGNKMYLEIMER